MRAILSAAEGALLRAIAYLFFKTNVYEHRTVAPYYEF